MSLIDWDHPEPHTRLKKGKPYTESRFWAECLCCGAKRLLKKCDARIVEEKGSPCLRCANVIKGRAGWQATVAKKGVNWVSEKARERRLANPSCLERTAMAALECLGLSYQREVPCGPYYIDFVLGGIAIEVEGAYVHSLRDPLKEAQRKAYIEQEYALLTLYERSAASFTSTIALFMEMHHVSSRQILLAYA
jgi:very-short-patch-repair endonuclease